MCLPDKDQHDLSTSSADVTPVWNGVAPGESGKAKVGKAAHLEQPARLAPLASVHSGKGGWEEAAPLAKAAPAAAPAATAATSKGRWQGHSCRAFRKTLTGNAAGSKAGTEAKAGIVAKAWAIRGSRTTEIDISSPRKVFLSKLERKGFSMVPRFLQTSIPCVRADPECVLAAVRKNASAFEFAADSLKSDKEFMLNVLKIDGGDAIMRAAESFQVDGEIIAAAREAFCMNWFKTHCAAIPWEDEDILEDAPPFLQADRESFSVQFTSCQYRPIFPN